MDTTCPVKTSKFLGYKGESSSRRNSLSRSRSKPNSRNNSASKKESKSKQYVPLRDFATKKKVFKIKKAVDNYRDRDKPVGSRKTSFSGVDEVIDITVKTSEN